MEPKRYIGNDLARIYQRVRRELGPDAVIVETRSLLREGAEALIELLAYGPDDDGLSLELQQQMVSGVLARVERQPLPRTIGDLEDLAAREHDFRQEPQVLPTPFPPDELSDLPEWLEGFVEHAPSAPGSQPRLRSEELEQLPPLKFAARPVPRASQSLAEMPIAERSPLSHLDPAHEPVAGPFAPAAAALSGHLTAAGFSQAAALAVGPFALPGRSMEDALGEALSALPVAYPDERRTSIISIQGAAGSGRTTALIRMALDCADSGRTALLVAADNSRIAAREQIHAYGEALGLQVIDAYSNQELAQAVTSAARGACLVVDVPAGPWQPPAVASAAHFAYLAVPAHWQPLALANSLAPFPQSNFAGVVLTFADITGAFAAALSVVLERRAGVAFLSCSRDVSTGIAVADLFTLASGIFTTPSGVIANGRLVASA